METIVEELKKIFTFKDTTGTGDVVLVVSEDPQMILYALVLDIERDPSKRDEWWHVCFQFLTLPPQQVVWTLRTAQFTGQEIFTMGGKKKFIGAVDFPPPEGKGSAPPEPRGGNAKRGGLRVVK